jgi:hypothetical protein
MDIVEIQLLIVVVLLMVIVVLQHAVLVFVVHDMDIVVQLVLIVHSKNLQVIFNQLQLKVSLKDKRHITMKPRLAHNTQHVVLNEDIH